MHLISMGGNDKMPFHRETLQKWGKIELLYVLCPRLAQGCAQGDGFHYTVNPRFSGEHLQDHWSSGLLI